MAESTSEPPDESGVRVIWQGNFLDGYIYLFCAHEDKEVHVMHYKIQAYDILITGHVHFEPDAEPETKIRSGLVQIQTLYLKAVIDQRDEEVKRAYTRIH